MPAQATANSVIASAKRLIEVRHVCWSSSRIAEISVPAWPMPIHQTKFVMSNAQPTGMLMPQMPMPLTTRYDERHQQQAGQQRRPMSNARYQPIGVRWVRTMELILSVTEANVCPGAITMACPTRRPARIAVGDEAGCSVPSQAAQFRIHIPHGRQVRRARPRVQLASSA